MKKNFLNLDIQNKKTIYVNPFKLYYQKDKTHLKK